MEWYTTQTKDGAGMAGGDSGTVGGGERLLTSPRRISVLCCLLMPLSVLLSVGDDGRPASRAALCILALASSGSTEAEAELTDDIVTGPPGLRL